MKQSPTVDERFDRVENRIQDVLDALQTYSTHMDRRFDELRAEFKEDFTSLRTELKSDIVDLRTELKGDIALVRADIGIANHKLDRMDVRVNRLEAI